jgi:hypothetical protein
MKIILAQFKKDLASARGLFWLWAGCVSFVCLCFLGRVSLPVQGLSTNGVAVFAFSVLGIATGLIASFAIQLILFMVLVVRIIHADPLTEPNAFWRTRPVSRSSLLAEKLLLIALLLLGELLASLAMGVRPERTMWLAGALHFLTFTAGLAAFAAVTSNLSRLIVTSVVIGFAAQVAAAIVLALVRRARAAFQERPMYSVDPGPFFGDPAALVISAFFLVGFLVAIICQYLTLRTNVSRAILCATFFLATLLQSI